MTSINHLKLGTFLKTLDLKGNDKILIDTGTWSYTNVLITSNMPDRFIKNKEIDPFNPTPAVLNFKGGIDVKLLKKKNIKYLVFEIPESSGRRTHRIPRSLYFRANIFNTSRELRKINQIGGWGIFAVQ